MTMTSKIKRRIENGEFIYYPMDDEDSAEEDF